MKGFIVGFRIPAQYRRQPAVAEDEEQAKELVTQKYKKFGISGKAEILERSPFTSSGYWISEEKDDALKEDIPKDKKAMRNLKEVL